AEPEHPYRSVYQRDRDRILHSSAFRRLSGKTQVFTGDMGDYHRTRLTHTYEVASIARTLSRALRLNEDLAEALALFHDVGHPPFGHAGEAALHACLRDHGGFSHNQHALTVAEEIEQRYPNFPGLNLTCEVLDSQVARAERAADSVPLLEAQIVDAADSITYDAHDTDDAVKLGLLNIEQLADIPLIARMVQRVRRRFATIDGSALRKALVHELIDYQVSDVLRVNDAALTQGNYSSAAEARQGGYRVRPSQELAEEKAELERYLYLAVYRHPRLLEVRAEAQQRLRELFDFLVGHPHHLPEFFQERIPGRGLQRAVGDYMAGMTDRFFRQQYERLRPGGTGG
ncbi:MAG: dGTP triphosphohydrolase, partial [Pirellulaceae bacterium]